MFFDLNDLKNGSTKYFETSLKSIHSNLYEYKAHGPQE